jgi:hypothetical protein
MEAGALLALALALALAAFIGAPLLRRGAADPELVASPGGAARDLQSRRDMLLSSLKDVEDDRATDKIGESDYAELHARLSAEAVDVLKQLDALQEAQEAEEAQRAERKLLRHRRAGSPDSTR